MPPPPRKETAMKIVLKRSVAGRHDGRLFSYFAGQVVRVPDSLARELIRAKHAEPAKPRSSTKKPKSKK